MIRQKQEIEQKLKKAVDGDPKIPSAYLLVHSDRHKIHWSMAHGKTDEMPANANQSYHTASIAKTFTAMMIALLVEEVEVLGIEYAEKERLLRELDFICVLMPYTPETKNYIGATELSLMKQTAVLVNTARGGIVDEEALYHALKSGDIWGAAIDAFEEEPVRTSHPLLSLRNVVALPHIGSVSVNTRLKKALLAAENLLQGIQGETPKYLVN